MIPNAAGQTDNSKRQREIVDNTSQLVSTDDKVRRLQALIAKARPEVLDGYYERLRLSWIYHDSALEGVVYNPPELNAALGGQEPTDPALAPLYDEIRQSMQAITLVREMTDKKKAAITLEVIKQIYCILAPDEAPTKAAVKYRKDMPLHRLYFHDIAPPDKIGYRMRLLIDWINAPETQRTTHPLRLASRAHAELLYIYPFNKHSGKVARLIMNLIALRQGYPPIIIHFTERQRYYEALKQSPNEVAKLVHESLLSSVETGIRYFESQGIH